MKRILPLLFTSLVLLSGCGGGDKQDPQPNPDPTTPTSPTSPTGFANLTTITSEGTTYTLPDAFALQASATTADLHRVYYISVTNSSGAKGPIEVKYYITDTDDLRTGTGRVTLSIDQSREFSEGRGAMTFRKTDVKGTQRFVINGTFEGTVGAYKNATGTFKDVVVY